MKRFREFISTFNQIIIESDSFSEIGDKLVEIISPFIPVEWSSICIIKGEKVLISSLSSKIPSYFKEGEEIPLSGTATEYVAKTKKVLYEKDLSKGYKFYTGKYHFEKGIRSMLRIPLLSRGEVFAVWVIASSRPNAYTEKDIKLLKFIASQISVPLKLFMLYEESKTQYELLQSINNLSRFILSEVDINRVFQKFAEELKKYIPFDRLSIGIIEGKDIKYVAVSEVIKTGRIEGTKVPLSYTASSKVIKTGKSLIRKDIAKDKIFPLDETKLIEGIRSAMHIPLIFRGKIWGTLNFSSTKPNAYGEKEKFIAETLASQISGIIAITYIYSPFYNHLTEVYNRRYFDERFDEEIEYRKRYGGEFCVCLCDVDNFKNYNDLKGHLEGDKCLKEIAQIMKSTLRKTDLVFRYGGDEFVVIMPDTSFEDAVKVMERVRKRIKEKLKDKNITLSIGISSYPRDGTQRTELLDKADKRLLKAKEIKNFIVYQD